VERWASRLEISWTYPERKPTGLNCREREKWARKRARPAEGGGELDESSYWAAKEKKQARFFFFSFLLLG